MNFDMQQNCHNLTIKNQKLSQQVVKLSKITSPANPSLQPDNIEALKNPVYAHPNALREKKMFKGFSHTEFILRKAARSNYQGIPKVTAFDDRPLTFPQVRFQFSLGSRDVQAPLCHIQDVPSWCHLRVPTHHAHQQRICIHEASWTARRSIRG